MLCIAFFAHLLHNLIKYAEHLLVLNKICPHTWVRDGWLERRTWTMKSLTKQKYPCTWIGTWWWVRYLLWEIPEVCSCQLDTSRINSRLIKLNEIMCREQITCWLICRDTERTCCATGLLSSLRWLWQQVLQVVSEAAAQNMITSRSREIVLTQGFSSVVSYVSTWNRKTREIVGIWLEIYL